ncbi:hypothetical protein J3Q64DRAFT_1749484 [Phycomyces blakesleeanus]
MSLEDHLYLALAPFFILFLSPSQYHHELKPLFRHENWFAAMISIHDMDGIKKFLLPLNIVIDILAIIDNLLIKPSTGSKQKLILRYYLFQVVNTFTKALSALFTKLQPV